MAAATPARATALSGRAARAPRPRRGRRSSRPRGAPGRRQSRSRSGWSSCVTGAGPPPRPGPWRGRPGVSSVTSVTGGRARRVHPPRRDDERLDAAAPTAASRERDDPRRGLRVTVPRRQRISGGTRGQERRTFGESRNETTAMHRLRGDGALARSSALGLASAQAAAARAPARGAALFSCETETRAVPYAPDLTARLVVWRLSGRARLERARPPHQGHEHVDRADPRRRGSPGRPHGDGA